MFDMMSSNLNMAGNDENEFELKILQWNAGKSIPKHNQEFIEYIGKKEFDILLLQETPTLSYLPNPFETITKGNTSICYNKTRISLDSTDLSIDIDTNETSIKGITVYMKEFSYPILILSAYRHIQKTGSILTETEAKEKFSEEIENILIDNQDKDVILGGDFNIRTSIFGSDDPDPSCDNFIQALHEEYEPGVLNNG